LRLIGRLQRFGDDWCPEDILKQLGHRLRKDMRFSTLLRWFKYPLLQAELQAHCSRETTPRSSNNIT
jgi:hypothetical protein